MKKLLLSFVFLTGYQLQAAESHAAQADQAKQALTDVEEANAASQDTPDSTPSYNQTMIPFKTKTMVIKQEKERFLQRPFWNIAAEGQEKKSIHLFLELYDSKTIPAALEFQKNEKLQCPSKACGLLNMLLDIGFNTETEAGKYSDFYFTVNGLTLFSEHASTLLNASKRNIFLEFKKMNLDLDQLVDLYMTILCLNFKIIKENKQNIKFEDYDVAKVLADTITIKFLQAFKNNEIIHPETLGKIQELNDLRDPLIEQLFNSKFEILHILTGHTKSIYSAAFSPDSSLVVTASGDNTAKIWNTQTGECVLTLEGHTAAVLSGAFNHDNSRVVTGSADNTVKVWDTQTGECIHTLEGHTAPVYVIQFHPSNHQAIQTVSLNSTEKVFNIETGACLRTGQIPQPDTTSTDKTTSGMKRLERKGNLVQFHHPDKDTQFLVLEGHTANVTSCKPDPKGKLIVTTSEDQTARIWGNNTLPMWPENFEKVRITTLGQALEVSILDAMYICKTGQKAPKSAFETLASEPAKPAQKESTSKIPASEPAKPVQEDSSAPAGPADEKPNPKEPFSFGNNDDDADED